jgi:DUF971 family protein
MTVRSPGEDKPLEDPKLETDISQVKELIGIWQSYYRLLVSAFDKDKPLPGDAEAQFQSVKTVVAQRHDHFSSVIRKDHYVAQNILQMVKRTISIFDFEKSSAVAIDKTLIEWHEANILLWETLGALEYKRHQLSKVSELEVKKEEAKRARRDQLDNLKRRYRVVLTTIPVILTLAVLSVIGTVLFGALNNKAGIWAEDNIPFTKPFYKFMHVEIKRGDATEEPGGRKK